MVPEGVEVVRRVDPKESILRFFINHDDESVTVSLSGQWLDILSAVVLSGEFLMGPDGVGG